MARQNSVDYGYVDMHCHILPKVDDGADSMETSLRMLDIAYSEGIRTILATPHHHPRRSRAGTEEILAVYEEFSKTVTTMHPDMKLLYGREVYYTVDVMDEIETGKALLIGDTRYILVEYSTSVEPAYLVRSVNNIIQLGYIPIVAHVERYACVVDDWELIYELKNMGAVIQVNADSVIGELGRSVKKAIKHMLTEELVDIIGTDAHNSTSRAPHIEKCAKYLKKKFGEEYARMLLADNAETILQGKYLEEDY